MPARTRLSGAWLAPLLDVSAPLEDIERGGARRATAEQTLVPAGLDVRTNTHEHADRTIRQNPDADRAFGRDASEDAREAHATRRLERDHEGVGAR